MFKNCYNITVEFAREIFIPHEILKPTKLKITYREERLLTQKQSILTCQ